MLRNIFRLEKPGSDTTYSLHSYKFKDEEYILNYHDAGSIVIINGPKEIKKQRKLLILKEMEVWSKYETQMKKFKWFTIVVSIIFIIIFSIIINDLLFLIFPFIIGVFIFLRLRNKLINKMNNDLWEIRRKNISIIRDLEDEYAVKQLKESFAMINPENKPKKVKHIFIKDITHDNGVQLGFSSLSTIYNNSDVRLDCYEWRNKEGRTLNLEELGLLFTLKSQLFSFECDNQHSKRNINVTTTAKIHYIIINDFCFYVKILGEKELDINEKKFYYDHFLEPFSGKLDDHFYVDGSRIQSTNEIHKKKTIKASEDLNQENDIYEVIAEEREYYEINNPENKFWGYWIDIHLQDVGMHIEGVNYYGNYPVIEAKDNNGAYNYYMVKDIPYEVDTDNNNRFHNCGEFKTEEAAKRYLDDIKIMKYRDALKRGLIPAPFKNQ